MDNEYVLLIEIDELWAKMLIEVLENNNVSYFSQPCYGAGFIVKTGTQNRLKIYVLSKDFIKAKNLTEQLFGNN